MNFEDINTSLINWNQVTCIITSINIVVERAEFYCTSIYISYDQNKFKKQLRNNGFQHFHNLVPNVQFYPQECSQ